MVTPCREDMLEHVQALTDFRGGESDLVELAWSDSTGAVRSCQLFSRERLDDLVDLAARVNSEQKVNVYVAPALRRADLQLQAGRRPQDPDATLTRAIWADFDEPGAYETAMELLREHQLEPSMVVQTGTQPSTRAQVWWWLDEGVRAAQQTELRASLARALGGDPTIQNPSRVMRLAGSVAWNLKGKIGRADELVEIIHDSGRSYDCEDLEQRVRRWVPTTQGAEIIQLPYASEQFDIEELIERAKLPGLWDDSVTRLVGSMVRRGFSDAHIASLVPLLQMDGYTHEVTFRQVMSKVAYARRSDRIGVADPGLQVQAEAPEPERITFNLAGLESLPPPSWTVHGVIPERGIGFLYGPSNLGKSFLTLDMGLCVAAGLPWHGVEVKQKVVLHAWAEDPAGAVPRQQAWLNGKAPHVRETLLEKHWTLTVPMNLRSEQGYQQMKAEAEAVGAQLIIVDTLSDFLSSEAKHEEHANQFIDRCKQLSRELDAFVLIVHHPTKSKDSPTMSGSGVLYNRADVVWSLSKGADGGLQMQCEKARNMVKPDRPMQFTLEEVGDSARISTVGEELQQKGRPAAQSRVSILAKMVRGAEYSTTSLAQLTGFSVEAVRSQLRKMDGEEVTKVRSGVWALNG